jgi:peptidoglycan hydrolase CwlO-like protein
MFTKTSLKNKNKNIILSAKKVFAIFALFLLSFLVVPVNVQATLQDDLNNVNEEINEAKDELAALKAEKNTLQGQINAFNKEISNIEYQISLTDRKVNLLNAQIVQTAKEIKQAELDLAHAKNQLSEIIKAMYEDGQLSALEVVAKSNSFSEYVNRSEYMEQMQVKVKDNADKVVALKNKLDANKLQLESGKKETLALKSEQLGQRTEVAGKKSAKDNLLAITKGNESTYLNLVKNLQKERDKIEAEIWSNANGYVSLGSIEKGQIVGYQGNTGYSTGPHLHFEIRTPDYVAKNPVLYVGNGTWSHPLPGARISCGWGCYSGHKGTDYVKYYGAPVLAAADGEIIYRRTGRPNTYPGSFEYGNYVLIKHYNGWYSLYAHLQ